MADRLVKQSHCVDFAVRCAPCEGVSRTAIQPAGQQKRLARPQLDRVIGDPFREHVVGDLPAGQGELGEQPDARARADRRPGEHEDTAVIPPAHRRLCNRERDRGGHS